jgi:hypothetical protein
LIRIVQSEHDRSRQGAERNSEPKEKLKQADYKDEARMDFILARI